MKQAKKVYLTTEEERQVLAKAKDMGIEGRGALSRLLVAFATRPLVLVSGDVLELKFK